MHLKDLIELNPIVFSVIWQDYVEFCKLKNKKPVYVPDKRIAALLDKNFGVSEVTSNRPKARKN